MPRVALDAAAKVFPGAKAEREWIDGVPYREVVLDHAGARVEFLVREDGTESGREEVVAEADVPKTVRDAADRAVPGGTAEVVEKLSGAEAGGRGTEYHVKKRVDGEVQRIRVAPDGTVPLVLRKVKAEVKVPRRARGPTSSPRSRRRGIPPSDRPSTTARLGTAPRRRIAPRPAPHAARR